MYSYKPTLIKWINRINPKTIFEWGPGQSTGILLNNTSDDTRMVSVEHNDIFYEKAIKEYSEFKNKLTLLKLSCTNRASNYAHIILSYPDSDIIFIDGRRRVECCFAAMQKISKDGVLILHDSNRKTYMDILNPYINIIENTNQTLVFRPKYHLDKGISTLNDDVPK